MGTLQDMQMLGKLADTIQCDAFYHKVVDEYEKLEGRTLSEIERRQIVADLRKGVTVTITRKVRANDN